MESEELPTKVCLSFFLFFSFSISFFLSSYFSFCFFFFRCFSNPSLKTTILFKEQISNLLIGFYRFYILSFYILSYIIIILSFSNDFKSSVFFSFSHSNSHQILKMILTYNNENITIYFYHNNNTSIYIYIYSYKDALWEMMKHVTATEEPPAFASKSKKAKSAK